MESLLDSSVLTAAVTTIGALILTGFTYLLSTKKRLKKHRSEKIQSSPDTYAGYETLLKQYKAEVERLYSVAKDREEVIAILRVKENELYKEIEQKNQEISWLKHKREFLEESQRLRAQ